MRNTCNELSGRSSKAFDSLAYIGFAYLLIKVEREAGYLHSYIPVCINVLSAYWRWSAWEKAAEYDAIQSVIFASLLHFFLAGHEKW